MTAAAGPSPSSKPLRGASDGRAAALFLLPNILGVIVFTAFPVLFSLAMAFTNWDLKQHNQFSDDPIRVVGLRNFADLLTEGQFLRFLGNTLFFMIGIPLGIAGSLGAALLLIGDPRPGRGRPMAMLLASAGLGFGTLLLVMAGLGTTAMSLLLVGLFATILLAGTAAGSTWYRTLFYTPHFVTGVPTFILWKKLYNPQTGPINTALTPALGVLSDATNALPTVLVQAGSYALLAGVLLAFWFGLSRLRSWWNGGDLAPVSAALGLSLLLVPVVVGTTWDARPAGFGWLLPIGAAVALIIEGFRVTRPFRRPAERDEGIGDAAMVGSLLMIAQFVCLGLAAVVFALPSMAADGLEPPRWLSDLYWAKPALMIMGFWAALGSNTMLLYLAALTNVPKDLYEAADLDGARPVSRFWNVTWPQLAPTTFFVLVMGMIGGLQGGFEMAKVMTAGGPAGATTTLSYFIYTEGFATGRLGFASAVAWALFALVFGVTLVNWKFGNRYVNE